MIGGFGRQERSQDGSSVEVHAGARPDRGVADGLTGGALADDPHRRRATAMGGYTAIAVLTAAIGAATSAWQVGILRAGGWIARSLRDTEARRFRSAALTGR
jgi:hypothetical protein